MSLALLPVLFLLVAGLAYFSYGRLLSRTIGLTPDFQTPAHAKKDGEDYVPTPLFYLFGQHFSAIAAAGPIAGPILACQSFGWLPCLLWICLGVVVIGAVHDFVILSASVRQKGSSIAEIASDQLGSTAGRAMMGFILIALVYIIVAFTDITASSFTTKSEELQGAGTGFNAGGAVAFASVAYLGLALILGLVNRFLRPPLWLTTLIFVPLTFAVCYSGTWYSHLFEFSFSTWILLIILYGFAASLSPVWLLLQPRGYLGGFVLYFALLLGFFGAMFGGYEIQQPAFKGFDAGGMTGLLFPFLFVTIACGACSGFHGLVCSGTTSKQIDCETHVHPVGYGAMLAEGLVAILALCVVMKMSPEQIKGLKPGTIYGNGLGEYLALVIGKEHLSFCITFGAMAFSTFVFDTLDVAIRLGRYLLQEVTGWNGRMGQIPCTLAVTLAPCFILLSMDQGAWSRFWTLFGASNQLLAALSLLIITLWLKQRNKPLGFTLVPMLFILVTTLVALGILGIHNFRLSSGLDLNLFNALACAGLILLAAYLNILALLNWKRV